MVKVIGFEHHCRVVPVEHELLSRYVEDYQLTSLDDHCVIVNKLTGLIDLFLHLSSYLL